MMDNPIVAQHASHNGYPRSTTIDRSTLGSAYISRRREEIELNVSSHPLPLPPLPPSPHGPFHSLPFSLYHTSLPLYAILSGSFSLSVAYRTLGFSIGPFLFPAWKYEAVTDQAGSRNGRANMVARKSGFKRGTSLTLCARHRDQLGSLDG